MCTTILLANVFSEDVGVNSELWWGDREGTRHFGLDDLTIEASSVWTREDCSEVSQMERGKYEKVSDFKDLRRVEGGSRGALLDEISLKCILLWLPTAFLVHSWFWDYTIYRNPCNPLTGSPKTVSYVMISYVTSECVTNFFFFFILFPSANLSNNISTAPFNSLRFLTFFVTH